MDLEEQADRIRQLTCKMCLDAQSGHAASSLSTVDILTYLYAREGAAMKNPVILSKGHAAPALYAALALHNLVAMDALGSLREFGSPLQGHPDASRLPAVNASTGALGQGLSMAIGRAVAMQLRGDRRTSFCIIGDGESQEGQVWEAALFGGNRHLPNLVAFTDHNECQSSGPLSEVMPMDNLSRRWESFGWFVQEINGHRFDEISFAVDAAKSKSDSRPTMILAHTLKGYISPTLQILGGDHAEQVDEELYARVCSELGRA